MRPLKAWGFAGRRIECPGTHHQPREICAVRSIAELMRITGATRSELTQYGSETGNPEEVEVAMREPGVVFWKPIHHYKPGGWTRATPREGTSHD